MFEAAFEGGASVNAGGVGTGTCVRGRCDGGGAGESVVALSVLARLEALARRRAPLRRALARIAGRFVAARAHERLGFARLADYARERAGVSGRQLQDLAHVDARLAALPGVEAALVAGRLSWSKARLLARVARADDEADWLAFALRVPVRALEREVRAVDAGALEAGALASDEDGQPLYPMAGVIVRCAPVVRAKFHRARQVARRVAGERLPTWACMEAVAAEALSAVGGAIAGEDEAGGDAGACDEAGTTCGSGAAFRDREHADAEARAAGLAAAADVCAAGCPTLGAGNPSTETSPPVRSAAADVCAPAEPHALVDALLTGLDAADAFELDARLRRVLALEQRIDSELAPLLLRAAEARLAQRAGHANLAAFARERLGISERKARALVRIARVARGCRALARAFADGSLSWVQAQVLLPLLVLPAARAHRATWIARAARVSVRRLEDEVDAALAAGAFDRERQTCARPRDPEPHPPDAAERVREDARFFFTAPRDVARLFRAVACSVRRALERRVGRSVSEGEAIEWMFDHAFASWGANDPRVPRTHRVFARDGWRCTVPGCSSYRNLHDHHVVFRSAGGGDELANRTTLCAFHHLRGVHAGRVRCIGRAPAALRFELGLRRGRPPLLRYEAGEELVMAS